MSPLTWAGVPAAAETRAAWKPWPPTPRWRLRVSETIGRTIDITTLIAMIQAGELEAEAEIEQTIEYLAIAVAAVINIFNPAAVLIQSRMFDIRDDLFAMLLERVGRRALGPSLADCRILRSSGSKLQSAVAGTIHHLTSVLGPKM